MSILCGLLGAGVVVPEARAESTMPSVSQDPKGFLSFSVAGCQRKLAESGIDAKVEVDDKSLAPIDVYRARSAGRALDIARQGIVALRKDPAYKSLVAVKKLRVVHDSALTEHDVVFAYSKDGVLTERANLAALVISNLDPEPHDRVRLGFAAILDADRKVLMDKANLATRKVEQDAAADSPPRKLKVVIQWDDFKETRDWRYAKLWGGAGGEWGRSQLFSNLPQCASRLDFAAAKALAEHKGARPVHTIVIKSTKAKTGATKLSLKGTTLEATLSWQGAEKSERCGINGSLYAISEALEPILGGKADR